MITILDLLQQYSGALTVVATLLLVGITCYYAYLTKTIVSTSGKQLRLSLNPVIGIQVLEIRIGPALSNARRGMSVIIQLTNVGNAPAIEVLIDAEINLRYSSIEGHKTIPMRFEPDMVPFIKSGDIIKDLSLCFGNTLITHFFDDIRECERLNLHRIETDPTQESFKASRLRILAYYRNSLGQYFRSYYEAEIGIWKPSGKTKNLIPADNESTEVSLIYVPRPVFHADPSDEEEMLKEISNRNKIRDYCGW